MPHLRLRGKLLRQRLWDIDGHLCGPMLPRTVFCRHTEICMTTQYKYARNRPGSGTLLGIVLALLLGAAALAMFLRNAQNGLAVRLAAMVTGRSQTFLTAPEVVERIQRLSRLETVVYSLDTVVEGRQSSAVLPDALAGDRLLMIVHGQTIAGIDFTQLKPADIQISQSRGERSIRLKLPPSQVFFTVLDNAKTRVYTRNTGLFVAGDPNLESATRLKAQDELRQAALGDGILQNASRNAEDTLRAMLQGLGFTKVDLQ